MLYILCLAMDGKIANVKLSFVYSTLGKQVKKVFGEEDTEIRDICTIWCNKFPSVKGQRTFFHFQNAFILY
jgi:hypothetical protein